MNKLPQEQEPLFSKPSVTSDFANLINYNGVNNNIYQSSYVIFVVKLLFLWKFNDWIVSVYRTMEWNGRERQSPVLGTISDKNALLVLL